MENGIRRAVSRIPVRGPLSVGAVAAVLAAFTSVALGVGGRDSSPSKPGETGSARAKPAGKAILPLRATGILRYGTSYPKASGYDRYSYVIVGPGDARAAARLPGTSLVYKSGTTIYREWSAGMNYAEALANGWLLKDANGAPVMNAPYGGFVGDIGSRAYQQRFIDVLLAFLKQNHNDGVFLDDVLASPLGLNGSFPGKYPTNPEWENATVSFVASVSAALRSKGYYVLVNATAYVPGEDPSTTLDRYPRFYTRLAPHVDGLMNEYWMQNAEDYGQLRSIGSSWHQNFTGWQSLVSVAQGLGVDFFALTNGSARDVRAMRYGRAAFLLDWNGRDGAFVYVMTDRDDPFHPTWVKQLGLPVKKKVERAPGVWQRLYERGVVVLNATTGPVTLRVYGSQFSIGPTDALFARRPRVGR